VNSLLIAANVAVYVLLTLPLSGTAPDPSDPALRAYVDLLVERSGRAVPLRELLAGVSAWEVFVFEHGFRPAQASPTSLFTSMFLHANFLHLAGNMLFLWIYGDNVEDRLGRLGYLASYLGCGVAATLAHAAFELDSQVPMVGASGAISGALGFYFLFFPRNKVRLLVALFPFLVDVITVPARFVLGLYLLVDNLMPFLLSRGLGGAGVAYGAHIGGFVAGVALAWMVERRGRATTPGELGGETRAATWAAPTGAAIATHVREGRPAEAARRYLAGGAAADEEVDPEVALVLARWLAENAQATAALSVYRRVLRRHPVGRVAAEAHLGAGLVQLQALGRPTAAWQHFLDALDLQPVGDVAAAARRGLAAIEALGHRPRGARDD